MTDTASHAVLETVVFAIVGGNKLPVENFVIPAGTRFDLEDGAYEFEKDTEISPEIKTVIKLDHAVITEYRLTTTDGWIVAFETVICNKANGRQTSSGVVFDPCQEVVTNEFVPIYTNYYWMDLADLTIDPSDYMSCLLKRFGLTSDRDFFMAVPYFVGLINDEPMTEWNNCPDLTDEYREKLDDLAKIGIMTSELKEQVVEWWKNHDV